MNQQALSTGQEGAHNGSITLVSEKKVGYGWTPNNWKGWTATLIGILIVVALVRFLVAGLTG